MVGKSRPYIAAGGGEDACGFGVPLAKRPIEGGGAIIVRTVDVGAGGKQGPDHVSEALLCRDAEWRAPRNIGLAAVGAGGEQLFHDRSVAKLGRNKQRGSAFVVAPVNVGTTGDCRVRDELRAVLGRVDQRMRAGSVVEFKPGQHVPLVSRCVDKLLGRGEAPRWLEIECLGNQAVGVVHAPRPQQAARKPATVEERRVCVELGQQALDDALGQLGRERGPGRRLVVHGVKGV